MYQQKHWTADDDTIAIKTCVQFGEIYGWDILQCLVLSSVSSFKCFYHPL